MIVSRIAGNDPSLVELSLKENPKDDFSSIEELVEALGKNSSIQVVQFSGDFLPGIANDDDKIVLLEQIGKISSLKEIRLSDGSLPIIGLASLVREARALRVIDLQRVDIDGPPDHFLELEMALHKHTDLTEFVLMDFDVTLLGEKVYYDISKVIRSLSTVSGLEVLKLEGSKDCKAFFTAGSIAALCGCSRLQELHLSRFPLELLHFNMVSWIMFKGSLKSLSLPSTNLNDAGIQKILIGFGAGKDRAESENTSRAADLLECLDLSANHIGDDGCAILAKGLSNNRVLTHLSLAENKNIGPGGFASLAEMLQTHNTTLENLETPAGTDKQARYVIDEQLTKNREQKNRKSAMAA